MKPQIYYFGSLPSGFSAYPSDHTRTFFEQFLKRSKSEVQIVVHREGNLLHYGYVRKFSNNSFGIGLCIDCIYNDVDFLFTVFDDIYADMIKKGDVLKITSNGNIEWKIKSYTEDTVALNEYSKSIIELVDITESNSEKLPPADFSISINDCLEISLEASKEEIIDATKRYPNLYIAKTKAEIERVTSYITTLKTKNDIIKKLQQEIQDCKRELTKAKAQQRNLIWVSVLGATVLILGTIVWNKVLYPSEVTRYATGEFVYYGPLKNNKPHGTGVAIYPRDDGDGRKYYIGNFVNGERQDTAAILFYQDGDYYYGSMTGDKWEKGMLYMNSDNSHFKGTFKDNKAYNGTWYDHKQLYKMIDGVKSYR